MKQKFSYKYYSEMVDKLINKGYMFAFFPEAEKLFINDTKFVLMRHDVDIDILGSLKIAEMDAEKNVKSTFFFLIRTDLYNVFSDTGSNIIKKILNLGHEIGLHYDFSSYKKMNLNDTSKTCEKEVHVLEDWFSHSISAISFHKANDFVFKGNPKISYPIVHTHMPLFENKIKYFSDSRGCWRHGIPIESEQFRKGKPLHILTHPIWWNKENITSQQKICLFLKRKNKRLEYSIENKHNHIRIE